MASDRPPEAALGRVGRWSLSMVAAAGFVFLFIPIAGIVAFSFNDPAGKFNIVWNGFTLDNWKDPFKPGPLTDAMVLSLKVAGVAALAATVLGSLIALALVRYRFKGGALVNLLLVLPLTTPEIVMGSSLATLFFDIGIDRSFRTIVVAHVLFCTSFVALTVKARIRGFDWSLEDAAMDLGALRTAVWGVVRPLEDRAPGPDRCPRVDRALRQHRDPPRGHCLQAAARRRLSHEPRWRFERD